MRVIARAAVLFIPICLLLVPILLAERHQPSAAQAERLIIVTPHNEVTRNEFERAFATYAEKELHQQVIIDWRTPGGTNDIVRLVDDQFASAWRQASGAVRIDGFNDARLDKLGDPANDADKRAALGRKQFLVSDTSIDIDLFFGGGEYEFRGLADKGYLVDAGLIAAMPDIFRDDIIPQRLGGEIIYDAKGRYYGTCLASFGVCANLDRTPDFTPSAWNDLGLPRFVGQVAMADPSKSGSINACFALMIQQRMAQAVNAVGGESADALDVGWRDGFALIKRIGANARYVTDSASRVVRDVGKGDAALGMCIDFYGRSEAEYTRRQSGRERMTLTIPVGGSSVSADPIALFRGAPHRDLALAFIRFVLSVDGQKLWNYRPGEPGGPTQYALRRWSVRKDLYGAEHTPHVSDPGQDPFALAAAMQGKSAWTGAYFAVLRQTIKAIVLDPREELSAAWRAIIAAGGPDAVPDAMREFTWIPAEYHDLPTVKKQLSGDGLATTALLRHWSSEAQRHYHEAERLARLAEHKQQATAAP